MEDEVLKHICSCIWTYTVQQHMIFPLCLRVFQIVTSLGLNRLWNLMEALFCHQLLSQSGLRVHQGLHREQHQVLFCHQKWWQIQWLLPFPEHLLSHPELLVDSGSDRNINSLTQSLREVFMHRLENQQKDHQCESWSGQNMNLCLQLLS